MRAARWLVSSALLLCTHASAAPPAAAPAGLELRAGYLIGIALPLFRSSLFPERGTGNLNAELVLPKIWRANGSSDALLPRLMLGGTANLAGRTSYAYAGVLWTLDYAARNFAELSLGGMVHDGQLVGSDSRLARLGCRALYQVGINLGYRVSSRVNIMLSFDHSSNGRNYLSSCRYNEGLNLLGMRLGYRF